MKEKKEAFLKAFSRSAGIISTACAASGISRQTYYNWMQTDEAFREEVEETEEEQIDIAETHLLQRIKDGDATSIMFYLKTKGKRRGYSEKYEVEKTERLELPRLTVDECLCSAADSTKERDTSGFLERHISVGQAEELIGILQEVISRKQRGK